jgi:hypothetical protein
MLTRITGVTAVVSLALLLAACGAAEEEGTADVASLVTEGPAGTATPPGSALPAAQERPLERPDASQEDLARLYAVFDECMQQNGFPQPDGTGTLDQKAAAEKVCGHLQPETLSKRAERTDPHYADHHRDWITCLRAKGIEAWGEPGELLVEEALSPEDTTVLGECEMKAFAMTLEAS